MPARDSKEGASELASGKPTREAILEGRRVTDEIEAGWLLEYQATANSMDCQANRASHDQECRECSPRPKGNTSQRSTNGQHRAAQAEPEFDDGLPF